VSYTGTAVVIPTRNRADLVRNAVKSVLEQPEFDAPVFISDNSTSLSERAELRQYAGGLKNSRVHYIAPPEPLSMTRHWDWAMRQAMALCDASHVTFLTDRMIFKPGELRALAAIIRAYPDKILTYMHDMVDDFSRPVVVRQYTWTGNLYEVSSTRLLELVARSLVYDSSIPRMLNCIVPRALLEAIRGRFGNFFDSIAPDWNFAFRSLAVVDSTLFYDRASLVHYAQDRSNGQSANYGITNSAYQDFVRDLGSLPRNFAAPFPEIMTVWNAIISEYCHTKKVTQSPKFPELDMEKYVHALAIGIERIIDPERRQSMREALSARGIPPPPIAGGSPSPRHASLASEHPG
jgi:glycosyltransferase involved in cell wall biosynthesis